MAASKPLSLTGNDLTLEEVIAVARDRRPVQEITPDSPAYGPIRESAEWVRKAVEENAARVQDGQSANAYYGINTGFGIHAAGRPLTDPEQTRQLSRKLVMSHAVGTGGYLDEEVVRAALLIRANTLAKGRSGVRVEVINLLVQMLNRRITPAVPSIGSLGASGDLAPLAHLALVMSRPPDSMADQEAAPGFGDVSGEAFVPTDDGEGRRLVSGAEAMVWDGADHRLVLGAKEGLALNNGVTFSAALGVLALHDAERLAQNAQIIAALSLEALLGFRDAFLPQLQTARGHPGQIAVAANMLALVEGSRLADEGDAGHDPVHQPPQDPYSLRCIPQVVGAICETLAHIREVLVREINAASDNPLIFVRPEDSLTRDYKVISGGNFHGEYLAFAMDHLSIALTELGSISERRTFWMLNPPMARGLPSMLVEAGDTHVDSGVMLSQYVAAALVSKCKTLSHPDSVDSIPTSANQEDHVSMSMNAALHAREVVENITAVLAIEALSAVLAIRHRLNGVQRDGSQGEPLPVAALGRGAQAIWALLERQSPRLLTIPLDRDVILYPYLREMILIAKSGALADSVRSTGIAIRRVRSRIELVDEES